MHCPLIDGMIETSFPPNFGCCCCIFICAYVFVISELPSCVHCMYSCFFLEHRTGLYWYCYLFDSRKQIVMFVIKLLNISLFVMRYTYIVILIFIFVRYRWTKHISIRENGMIFYWYQHWLGPVVIITLCHMWFVAWREIPYTKQ